MPSKRLPDTARARRARWLLVAAMTALGPVGLAWAGEVVERILAVVDSRPLLLTDRQALARVRGLEPGAALEALIDEHLMFQEAARLPQAAVSPAEEQAGLDSLLASHAGLEAEVGAGALRALARRQIAILKYVEFRFRPQIRIPEDLVQETYQAESGGTTEGSLPADVAARIREQLQRRALDGKVEDWVRELRAAAKIRYNRP
jgi:hypothetical protein